MKEFLLILEKVREARRYYDRLPYFYRKPFLAVLKNTRDLDQAREAVEFWILEADGDTNRIHS
jgi:hypothetical protein